jgi:hypothetical protein
MKKTGIQLRDAGMQLALFNADDKVPGWPDQARRYLERFIHEKPFLKFQAEDVRAWAYGEGLPVPAHGRAWGSVITKAKRDGLIRFVGYENVTNPRAHSTPASVWRANNEMAHSF